MGQRVVYEVLAGMGGTATESALIEEIVKSNLMGRSRAWHTLAALRNMGYVRFDPKLDVLVIAEPFPAPNRATVRVH